MYATPNLSSKLDTSCITPELNSEKSKTAFTRCRQILNTVKNVTDRPPVHTKTAHFLPADFENGRF